MYCIENKARFIYKGNTSFKEELVISNVTSDASQELGYGIRKWKSLTLGERNYAIGMNDTEIYLLTTRGGTRHSISSKRTKITEAAIKILDVQLHKVWNSASHNFDPAVLVLLEGGSLSWFKTNESLGLELLCTLEIDKDAFQFEVYTIDKIDYLFVLNGGNERNSTTLDMYKVSVTSSKYKFLWREQTIHLEVPTTSFTLNSQGSNYYLSITQQSLHHIQIYKRVEKLFKLRWKITNTDADTLRSFSIGPKTYVLTNNVHSGIYRVTNNGPVRETLNENNIINWLPVPLITYRDEIFLLAQKEIHHDSHNSHSMELIHWTGFDFNVYHEIPCIYYNNSFNGLDCLVEEDEHHIELNMSAILPFENVVGLIITKKDLHSQLFILNIDVNKIPHPEGTRIERLQQIKHKLEDMQKKVQELKAEKEKASVLKTSQSQAAHKEKIKHLQQRNSKHNVNHLKEKYSSIKETISKLKEAMENYRTNNGFKIKKWIINGNVRVEGISNISNLESKTLNNNDTLRVIRDIVQKNDIKIIKGMKTFENVKVENINFDTLNGIDKSKFIFIDGKTSITLKGNVEFTKDLEVTGNITTTSMKVNNVVLGDEVVFPGKKYDSLTMNDVQITDNLEVKNINSFAVNESDTLNSTKKYSEDYFDKTFENLNITNLKVDNINSENFTWILQNVVMKNLNYSIPGKLELEVLNVSNANVSFLNNLTFPDDYVAINSTDKIHITGDKKFEGETVINSLTINGSINGINPPDIEPSYKDMAIKDVLKPNDIVNTLEVEGAIIVAENIDYINVKSYLNNILWKTSNDTNIVNCTKTFKTLSTPHLHVDTINNISINSFVNKLQNRTLDIEKLEGNVTIENLYTTGNIDDVDVRDLLENSIKLSGDYQHVSSSLTFSEVDVNNLHILETLNDLSPNEYLNTDGEKNLSLEKLKSVNISEVIVKGEVFGKIDGFDIENLQGRILRKNGYQEISGEIHVDELYVNELHVQRINENDMREMFDADHFLSLMEKMILENKVRIGNLSIFGNFTLETINNIKMKDIVNSLKFTKENNLQSNITFRDNVSFGSIKVKHFNDVLFEDLLENLIFKNETKVKINSRKIFLNGITVNKYIETRSLNGILLENILRKGNTQRISGPIIIDGNVSFEDDVKLDKLNGVSLVAIEDMVNISGDHIHIKGDVLFNQSAEIKNLVLHGYFNNNNITDVIINAIGLDDNVVTKASFTFTNKVSFKENLNISGTFNSINLSESYKDIVLINEDDYIEGLVSFKEPVEIKGKITVESDLLTDTIMGINPREWLNKGLFVSKELTPGKLIFENITVLNSITTNFLNNANASRFIPLQTDQTIKEHLIIENIKVDKHLNVNGFVNGVELYPEYLNTVLITGVQNVTSKVKFHGNVVVYGDLSIKGKTNNVDFDKVVFVNDHQTLNGKYRFLSTTNVIHLKVVGLINDINFNNWYKTSLRKSANQTQNVYEPINVKNLVIEDNSYGGGLISGFNISNIAIQTSYKLQDKKNMEDEFMAHYKVACKDVNYLLQASKKQILKFKYLEYLTSIYFSKNVNVLFNFVHRGQYYLLVNQKHSCDSNVLLWNYKTFEGILDFKTGILGQIIIVKSEENHLYLIGLSSSCSMHKTNLWVLQNNTITEHRVLDDVNLLQESLIPNTFYAIVQNEVREYKIIDSNVYVYRKWIVTANDNIAFVPRGLKTGPALRDGQKLIILEGKEEADVTVDYDVQEILLGEKKIEKNKIMPGKNGEMVVLNVGKYNRTMVAISSREGSCIKTTSDSIKIYCDVLKGKLFHKIRAYKPSSITSLEFDNGETLLLFLEDQKALQVYAYKGIEGFQHLKTAKIYGQQITKMRLPTSYYHSVDILVILNNNELSLVKVVMDGSDSTEIGEMYCEL